MKREKEVPAGLLAYLKERNEQKKECEKLNIFCTHPVKVVKMKMLKNSTKLIMSRNGCKIQQGTKIEETSRMAIIPAIDVYVSNKPFIKPGFLKRDALSFFVSGTRVPLPYGHIYCESGYVCLGNIFVPSAVPERAVTMPIETLFLHNDRNLLHGNSHLFIDRDKYEGINRILFNSQINIKKDTIADHVVPGTDIIQYDQIWNLSADVLEQKSLPDALKIMGEIYAVIFPVGMKVQDCLRQEDRDDEGIIDDDIFNEDDF